MPIKQNAAGAGSTGALVFGLVVLAFGFAAGYVLGEKKGMKAPATANVAQTGMPQTNDLPPGGEPVAPQEVLSTQGKVVAVSGDTLTIDARVAGSAASARLTLQLAAGTTYARREEMSPEDLQAAQEKFIVEDAAFAKAVAEGNADGEPPRQPEPFSEKAATKSSLAAGQTVLVTAKTSLTAAGPHELKSVIIIADETAVTGTAPVPAPTE